MDRGRRLRPQKRRQLDEGEVRLADLDLSIVGRAKSAAAFDALQELASAGAPEGVSVRTSEIAAAHVESFEWSVNYDGQKIEISGYKPSEEFVEQLMIADIGGRPVSTSLVLASGAPEGFEDNAVALLQNLLQLERGRATISGDVMTLEGAPADATTAERVRTAMTPRGARVTLEPPKVDHYVFEASVSGETILVKGFVPDQATKDRIAQLPSIDATALELARGAPERFVSGIEFGLEALRRMSEGSFSIDGTSIVLEGRAATLADFSTLNTTMSLGAPQGLILKAADIAPPIASPFTFAAEKGTGSTINLSGYVPSQAAQDALHEAAPIGADATSIADGEPADFDRLSIKALGVLELLDSGRVTYDGALWSISGAVDTAQESFAADTAFAESGLRKAGWGYAVTLPRAAEPAALPVIDPYVWRAQKSDDGTITIAGFVPTQALKAIVAGRSGSKIRDNSTLGAGAPEGFVGALLPGLDALLKLDEGTLAYDGKWSLSGETATATQRLAVQDALVAATDTAAWKIALEARDAPPLVEPFVWSAVKGDDGRVTLSGYMTTAELKRFVAIRAGNVLVDSTELGSGEPSGFMEDVLAGLEALSHLKSGEVRFDGKAFSLAGVPTSADDGTRALAALATASNAGAGWQTTLAEPVALPEPAPQPEPALAPEPEPTPAPEVVPAPAADATQVTVSPTPAVRIFSFEASKARGGPVELKGAVPADATRTHLGEIAGNVPIDALTVAESLPGDFVTNADLGVRTLGTLADGKLGFDGTTWVLEGRVASEADKTAALSALAGTKAWETTLTVLPPLEVCRDTVGAFASRNAILFQSGSARITEESGAALDELAADLQVCPRTDVYVEGHTDADGDEQQNLALSVARAEAVVEALIVRGIGFERLYAAGYGESVPVASNETRAGKQANRRIAFTIVEEQPDQ